MSRFVSLAVVFAACSAPVEVAPEAADASGLRWAEGTAEGLGMLALLNDPLTTVTVLDIDAALDARAARNLIARRDGPDARFGTADDNLYDTVLEVDNVANVGEATMNALVAFADMYGYQKYGDQMLGTWDGVDFTVREADATVYFVNTADRAALRAAGVNTTVTTALLAARPFWSVQAISLIRGVGGVTMLNLGVAGPVDEICRDDWDCGIGGLCDTGTAGATLPNVGFCR
jgi:hypothetical protein